MRRFWLLLPFVLAAAASPHDAVPPASLPGDSLHPATSYDSVFDALIDARPVRLRVAAVHDFVLTRDRGRFTLEQGTLAFLTPINGHTVGAVFQGTGRFSLVPPTPEEREALRRELEADSLDEEITAAVWFFADSTAAELEHRLHFQDSVAAVISDKPVRQALEYLTDEKPRYVEPDLMRALLNGDDAGLFYAHLVRRHGNPLMFRISPYQPEEVELLQHARIPPGDKFAEVVAEFHDSADYGPGGAVWNEPSLVHEVRHYAIETTLSRNAMGDVRFSAAATLDLSDRPAAGEWIAFHLYGPLEVDSARWASGDSVTAVKPKDNPILWVRAPADTAAASRFTLYYHGDLVERIGDAFFVNSSIAWYPGALSLTPHSTFDLTFHTPKSFAFASVGERVDSTEEGRVVTTRWVVRKPSRNASFNVGLFDVYPVQEEGAPPVTVLYADELHRALSHVIMQGRKMKENVGKDVANALKFFQQEFGPPPVSQFYATEFPDFHGEAFPGLIYLSWVTFAGESKDGSDDVFRAHEVAHQWWGIGVDYATYHDRWLSEGFAEFSGLWYLQTARRDNDKYFGLLHEWRDDLLRSRGAIGNGREAGPIWLGYRNARSDQPSDYQEIVYYKGAWVLHMLRVLMLDLNTMREDRFTNLLKEFYATYAGKHASTADFQRLVERRLGTNMDWFFREWVRGTAIPTYRAAYTSEPLEGGKYRIRLRVEQENVPDDFEAYLPVAVDLGQNRWARLRMHVQGPKSEMELPPMPAQPKAVQFNELDGVLCELKTVSW